MIPQLKEIGWLFLKLGIFAFGGPAAHIAMMQDEVVRRKEWMTEDHFLDLVGVTNLIPGPNSTEMAIHCGFHRGGVWGLFVSGVAFIFPAALLTGSLAYLYVEYQHVPQLQSALFGIKPAVLAIILLALYRLGKKALKSWQIGTIGLIAMALVLSGMSEVFAILIGGVLGILWKGWQRPKDQPIQSSPWLPLLLTQSAWLSPLFAATTAATQITHMRLFLTFLKVGSVLFGSGYVLVAYLDGELVQTLGWLTQSQLLDAIAIGQLTPGPVLATSTFIGYQLQGFWGAVLATTGIFLPSFLFVWLLNPIIPKMRQSKIASAFLDAVNISAVGLIAAVSIKLGQQLFIDWRSIAIFVVSAAAIIASKTKLSPIWLILGGAIIGPLFSLIQ
jgi:chromate transporter